MNLDPSRYHALRADLLASTFPEHTPRARRLAEASLKSTAQPIVSERAVVKEVARWRTAHQAPGTDVALRMLVDAEHAAAVRAGI